MTTANYTIFLEKQTTDYKSIASYLLAQIENIQKTMKAEYLQSKIREVIDYAVNSYNEGQAKKITEAKLHIAGKRLIYGNGASHFYISVDGETQGLGLGELMERRIILITFENKYSS